MTTRNMELPPEKAEAQGKAVGRPVVVVNKVDAELVCRLRAQGRSWREIAKAHPLVRSASGRKVRPSVGSIRRASSTAFLSSEAARSKGTTREAYIPRQSITRQLRMSIS